MVTLQNILTFILTHLGGIKMLKKYAFIIFSLIITIFIYTSIHSINIQKNISNKLIRLHVIANSNSNLDQSIKLKVRDEIIKNISPLLQNCSNVKESRTILENNINKIEKIANTTLAKYCNDTATVCISNSNFPTKTYDNFSFPAGTYEALKITIGEGKGENWWCVMFPPLCFTNSSIEFSDEAVETLKQNLDDEEYELISESNKSKVKIKFKLLEWLNK